MQVVGYLPLEDNIKIFLRHTLEFDVVYWMCLAQDRDK